MSGGFGSLLEVCNGQSYGVSQSQFAYGVTNVAPSNTVHTKGSWVQLSASLAADCDFARLCFSGQGGSAAVHALMFDIGIGGSGSELPIVSNIMVPVAGAFGEINSSVALPLSIPAGTRLSARCQADVATPGLTAAGVNFMAFASGFGNPEGGCGVDDVGSVVASTAGTVVTPGAGSKGSYAELVSATTRDYLGFFAVAGTDAGASGNNQFLIDIAIGPSGSEIAVIPNWFANPVGSNMLQFVPINVPSGTRISVRANQVDGSTTSLDVILYGVYK